MSVLQTFLPYANYALSAAVLDRQRLGKQRVEILQLLRVLTGQSTAWGRHPAAVMWRGHEPALAAYGVAVCTEWSVVRHYNDTCLRKICALAVPDHTIDARPWWFGAPLFHEAHRAALLRKNPEHYGRFFATTSPALPYYWPKPDGTMRVGTLPKDVTK